MCKLIYNQTNSIIVELGNKELFFIYNTLIAVRLDGVGYQVDRKYSATTTKHINKMCVGNFTKVDEEELHRLSIIN